MLDVILFLKSAALGMLQGVTEFLPVSSTGHMIIAGKLLQFDGTFAKTFEIFIQLGATSALIWHFRHDLWNRICNREAFNANRKFFLCIIIAFLPAALIGFLFHKKIDILLDSALAVGIAQILGACLILFAERISSRFINKTTSLNTVSSRQALAVGLWQIASLWPGMSRSGSTIMGGLLAKVDRPTATQFSFYLSIPISFASSFFMLIKHHDAFNSLQNNLLLLVGFVCAFVVGLSVVRFIMNYVRHHSFNIFAYYRFILGGVILLLVWRHVI